MNEYNIFNESFNSVYKKKISYAFDIIPEKKCRNICSKYNKCSSYNYDPISNFCFLYDNNGKNLYPPKYYNLYSSASKSPFIPFS